MLREVFQPSARFARGALPGAAGEALLLPGVSGALSRREFRSHGEASSQARSGTRFICTSRLRVGSELGPGVSACA